VKKELEVSKEYTEFSNALQKILKVSHSELKVKLEESKKNQGKRKRHH
jgi:hypothetical protein